MGSFSLDLFSLKWTKNLGRDIATVFEDVKGLLQRREMNCSLYFLGSEELRDLKHSQGDSGEVSGKTC